jgi:hypothetical protein
MRGNYVGAMSSEQGGLVDHSHIFSGHKSSLPLLVRMNNQGTNLAEMCCMFMSSVTVCWLVPNLRPNLPAIPTLVLYWSSLIFVIFLHIFVYAACWTAWMLTVINQSFPTFQTTNHPEVFVLPVALSPKTIFSTSFVSVAVFLSVKQNLTQRHCLSNHPSQKFRLTFRNRASYI